MVDYVDRAGAAVLENWTLPWDASPDSKVTVTIRLTQSGDVRELSALDEGSVVAQSALAAIRRAAPFGPLPPSAICLAEEPIVVTFRNPVDKGPREADEKSTRGSSWLDW